MRKIKEVMRFVVIIFVIGFIFGLALECTMYKSMSVDIRIGALWGAAFIIIVGLNDYFFSLVKQKRSIRKEEIDTIIKDMDREINNLKKKVPVLMSDPDKEGSHMLATIYIDRIIELEKLRERYRLGAVDDPKLEDTQEFGRKKDGDCL